VGVYHPRMAGRFSEDAHALPLPTGIPVKGTVGVLLLRSYLLSGNAGHYDGVIAALESKGLRVIPAFAAGLDSRPAIDEFFMKNGQVCVDAVVSLSGFSLVGGPAYNDAKAAEEVLAKLDVPYVAAHPVEFQTLDQWGGSDRGLLPVESTIMVAIPELDGSTSPMVFGGRPGAAGVTCNGCHHACTFGESNTAQDMHSCPERAIMLAARVSKMVALKRSERKERNVAIVLFNFPPNAGNIGTAAFLSVFESLWHTLTAMKAQGYQVDVPSSVDELREVLLYGNAAQHGADANVHALISADDHVKRERWLKEIEAQWGPAPGRQLSNGSSIFVLGKKFGNVLVSVQPSFGYEGDPMRLLFEKGLAPTHAFSAFYRYLREDFKAHAVLHFGTHGALEFMPGKQSGMSGTCWPDRLIDDLPNVYLYASNNPSEGAIAKRRSGATLISYLTPPIAQAGLYKGLNELKSSLERWRSLERGNSECVELAAVIQAQAVELDLVSAEPAWDVAAMGADLDKAVMRLGEEMLELEYTLIPHGLHVAGRAPSAAQQVDMLLAMAEANHGMPLARATVEALVEGHSPELALKAAGLPRNHASLEVLRELVEPQAHLSVDTEVSAILRALDARYIRPAPGGDILRTPAVLPTGRNIHGFDPFRIPSALAVRDGKVQAQLLIERHCADGNPLPESIAMVLWGSDNLKNEGAPIAQALALMGAMPRFDSYGRIAGASLIPLEELGRPRIDVIMTLSGIFRDLMPLQIKLLAEAAFLAASADEPLRPAPGGDILRTPAVLPTGRNIHGFDPFRIPSALAVRDGKVQAQLLIERHCADGNPLPESIAMVLWGSDNLKNEGAPIAQALALMGAMPRFDSYGRIAGASLIPLEELGRPRIDVIMTLSGIFRDLMPLQIKLLAEAAFLAASADEPLEMNWIRKHALAYQQEHGCNLETASLRVYGNAEGAYGSNVNNLVESSRWEDEGELAETYKRRKGFAYGRTGRAVQQTALLQTALADVQLTYQNLDSVELGVTTVDNYFDTLGGITHAVKLAKGGKTPPVYIGDQTKGNAAVRSLNEQVSIEIRTRMLNPKWYEGMLEHGYEGVRQIETHVTNTMGWSATTGQVQPWIYKQLSETFMLDPTMRDRLAKLNPTASARVANRLIEASERNYWQPDAETLQALRQVSEELEDRLEGVYEGATP